jgi:aerobic carbon-monoxide dehydrogenase large subunit
VSRRQLGARARRSHDPRLLTGRGAYVDDLALPGALHMAVWRSPLAHATVAAINFSSAATLPGVVDVFDIHAFGASPPTFPVVVGHESLKACPQYPLARDRVRYVGEGIVAVMAESRAIAQDALDLIDVSLDPLEPVTSTETAGRGSQLHAAAPRNVCAEWTLRIGDVDSAFRRADVVVRETFAIQRYTGVPIETRGVAAQIDPVSGELVIWVSGQWPHTTRMLAS